MLDLKNIAAVVVDNLAPSNGGAPRPTVISAISWCQHIVGTYA